MPRASPKPTTPSTPIAASAHPASSPRPTTTSSITSTAEHPTTKRRRRPPPRPRNKKARASTPSSLSSSIRSSKRAAIIALFLVLVRVPFARGAGRRRLGSGVSSFAPTASAFVGAPPAVSGRRRGVGSCAVVGGVCNRRIGIGRSGSVQASATVSTTTHTEEGGGESNGDDEEDLRRWERMYEEGENRKSSKFDPMVAAAAPSSPPAMRSEATAATDAGFASSSLPAPCEVRVVTFDLDNTLWRTSPTISAANDGLASYLDERNVDTTSSGRVEQVMGELFKRDPKRYCPDLASDGGAEYDGDLHSSKKNKAKAASPVLLTQLRKDAVRRILVHHNGYDENNPETTTFVDEAFETWLDARYNAISSHLAEGVLECLESIRSMRYGRSSSSSASGGERSKIIVGAITDGNSDPRRVSEQFRDMFDFVVNAESVGVSKPDARLYEAAAKVVYDMPGMRDTFFGEEEKGRSKDGNMPIMDGIGPWWVHVGDDFLKDVVAAKSLNMRSVWVRELVMPGKGTAAGNDRRQPRDDGGGGRKGGGARKAATTAPAAKNDADDVADLVKRLSENRGTIEMSIGPEDFLLDAVQQEFADAVLDRFGDVERVLRAWHEDAHRTDGGKGREGEEEGAPPPLDDGGGGDMAAGANSESPRAGESAVASSAASVSSSTKTATGLGKTSDGGAALAQKFCVFCGTKLPVVAKFCSSCGEKQPELK